MVSKFRFITNFTNYIVVVVVDSVVVFFKILRNVSDIKINKL